MTSSGQQNWRGFSGTRLPGRARFAGPSAGSSTIANPTAASIAAHYSSTLLRPDTRTAANSWPVTCVRVNVGKPLRRPCFPDNLQMAPTLDKAGEHHPGHPAKRRDVVGPHEGMLLRHAVEGENRSRHGGSQLAAGPAPREEIHSHPAEEQMPQIENAEGPLEGKKQVEKGERIKRHRERIARERECRKDSTGPTTGFPRARNSPADNAPGDIQKGQNPGRKRSPCPAAPPDNGPR